MCLVGRQWAWVGGCPGYSNNKLCFGVLHFPGSASSLLEYLVVGQLDGSNRQYDIAIVGGGIVGATLAAALAESSLRVVVLEAAESRTFASDFNNTEFEARVSALTLATRTLLKNLGVWDAMCEYRHAPYTDMVVWDAEGSGEIHFTAQEMGQKFLGYIFENIVLAENLCGFVQSLACVDWIAGAQIESFNFAETHQPSVTLADGTCITASLIVGADGANSTVRTKAGFETRAWSYEQQAIVATIRAEQGHQNTAWQHFLPSGPLAFLPLKTVEGDDHYCSIVWSVDNELAEKYIGLSDADFCHALQRAFEGRLGAIDWVSKRFAFPLRQSHALHYAKPGVVLIGDAAHTLHPLAGQGVNLGIMDAAVLAEEILRGHSRGLESGDFSILRRYQRRRKSDNLTMMAAVEGFKRLFGSSDPTVRWLRSAGLAVADSIAPIKSRLARRAMGIDGDNAKLAKVIAVGMK